MGQKPLKSKSLSSLSGLVLTCRGGSLWGLPEFTQDIPGGGWPSSGFWKPRLEEGASFLALSCPGMGNPMVATPCGGDCLSTPQTSLSTGRGLGSQRDRPASGPPTDQHRGPAGPRAVCVKFQEEQ